MREDKKQEKKTREDMKERRYEEKISTSGTNSSEGLLIQAGQCQPVWW